MGPDAPYDADIDPYVLWARGGPDAMAPISPPQDGAPALIPAQPPSVDAAPAPAPPDPYAAWAGRPVTSPSGPPPAGPVTSPEEVAAPGPANTPPPNAYGGKDVLAGYGKTEQADRAKALEAMTDEDRAAAVQSMTPDEFVAYKTLRNRQMVMKQAELEHQATADSERRAREDLEMQRAAIAKAAADTKDVVARADAIANTKIDPGRYARTAGTGGTIADVLSITLGGALSRYNGGRNLALEQFNKNVDNDIAAQHADIANRWRANDVRKNAIAEEYARSGDLYKAQETYRVAAYQSAINAMQSTLQQFDPNGGTAAAVRDQIDTFHQAQAQALNTFGQQQLKNHLELAEQDRKNRETASTIQKNRAEAAKLYSEASNAARANEIVSPAQIRAENPTLPVEAVPQAPVSRKELKQHLETYNLGLETKNKTTANNMQQAGTQIIGPDGKPLTRDGSPNSQPVVMSNHEGATKLNESIAGAQDLLDSLSSVRRFLATDPSAVDRKAWADAKTDIENAKFAFAKVHDTKASSRELEAMVDLFGPNPDSYTARVKDKGVMTAHIDALIRDAKTTVDNKLKRLAQYTGPSVIIDTSQPPAANETPEDKDLKFILSNQHDKLNSDQEAKQGFTFRQQQVLDGWAADIGAPPPQGYVRDPEDQAAKRKELDQVAEDMNRPPGDPWRAKAETKLKELQGKRAAALQALESAANDAIQPGVRAYAQQIMTNMIGATALSPSPSPGEP